MLLLDLQYYPLYKNAINKYNRKGVPTAYGNSGVYFIKENDVLVYIGMSRSCIVKACYRHFNPWQDKREFGFVNRISYFKTKFQENYSIAMVIIPEDKVLRAERLLITRYKPRDNSMFVNTAIFDKQQLLDYADTGPLEYPIDYVPF